jgi:large subunit ribosomal protein L10
LAKTKQQKEAMLTQYSEWLAQSKVVILVEYTGVKMVELDAIRARMREAGGEFHIVKNTLAKIALEKAGVTIPAGYSASSTAMGFGFTDAASVTKAFNEAVKNIPAIKVKGGVFDARLLDAREIKALAELPPLPIVRGQLLGVMLATAGKLARTLAEPGRQVASVLKAYSDQTAAPAAA